MSRPMDGFSAMMRVFTTVNKTRCCGYYSEVTEKGRRLKVGAVGCQRLFFWATYPLQSPGNNAGGHGESRLSRRLELLVLAPHFEIPIEEKS